MGEKGGATLCISSQSMQFRRDLERFIEIRHRKLSYHKIKSGLSVTQPALPTVIKMNEISSLR